MKKMGDFDLRKLLNGGLRRRFPEIRLALFVILVVAATGGLTTSSWACGTAVHHEVVDMAYGALNRQAYPALANLLDTTYQGAIDSGAVFPDMGYGRPADQAYWEHLSEDAHSAEFRTALRDYLMPTFRRLPGSEDDRRTLTFLFGVIAHQEADNPYHFGRDGMAGLLTESMRIDANDHTSVEIGSDVFANVDYGQGGGEDSWWTPLSAIRAAYLAIGHDVVESQIDNGMFALASAHTGLKVIGYPAYLAYMIDLSWTHDNLVGYPVGGLQDGANQTAFAWQQTWDWMSTYRLFLPSAHNGSMSSGLQSRANPTASAVKQSSDALRRTGDSAAHDPRLLIFGNTLLEEGVVKVHSRMENGNLIIERVEVLDYQHLNQIAEEILGVPANASSR